MAEKKLTATASASSNPPTQIQVDTSQMTAAYANFCRVAGGPEDVIVDFGLNPHPQGQPPEPIRISQRVVLNYYTAKRLLQVLHVTIQQHEKTFGTIETDVRKRVVPGAEGPGQE